MEHIMLKSLSVGDSIEGFYILKSAFLKVTANGKPFLSATFGDCSGDVEGKVWDYSGPISDSDNGKIVKIRGLVSEYRGVLQITIEKIRLSEDSDSYSLSELVPTAPIDVKKVLLDVEQMIESITDDDYKKICKELLTKHIDRFCKIPAAKSVHHSFLGGLLMHTYHMMKLADFLSSQYVDVVDRSLLLSGTFAHDLLKEEEFVFSDIGLVNDYSVKGNLIGHLVLCAYEIMDIAKKLGISENKAVMLQHMVLSHHGEPEMGAAVRPMMLEAELLSLIDLIDSRLEIYRENYERMESGEVSGKIFSLDKKIYKK